MSRPLLTVSHREKELVSTCGKCPSSSISICRLFVGVGTCVSPETEPVDTSCQNTDWKERGKKTTKQKKKIFSRSSASPPPSTPPPTLLSGAPWLSWNHRYAQGLCCLPSPAALRVSVRGNRLAQWMPTNRLDTGQQNRTANSPLWKGPSFRLVSELSKTYKDQKAGSQQPS